MPGGDFVEMEWMKATPFEVNRSRTRKEIFSQVSTPTCSSMPTETMRSNFSVTAR